MKQHKIEDHLTCPLCDGKVVLFSKALQRQYYRCKTCDGVHLSKVYQLSQEQEKQRYEIHHNDITNLGYQNFVKPIVNAVKLAHTTTSIGLDYGCGTGPVITSLLSKDNYKLNLYDPYFKPDTSVLNMCYDYIVCCEVVEHFNSPKKEFKLLKTLLKPKGKLYLKTGIVKPSVAFDSWWYKNDLTHVFFYSEKTISYISKTFGFNCINFKDDLIVLETK